LGAHILNPRVVVARPTTHRPLPPFRASLSQLSIKSINTARSAFCSIVLKPAAFEKYALTSGEATVQTCVLSKHLLASMRTTRMESLSLALDADQTTLSVTIVCNRGGVRKTYRIHVIEDAEHLKATIDAESMPVKLVLRPRGFSRLLSHFQPGQNDITIACLPETDGAERVERSFGVNANEPPPPRKNLKLTSYVDPNAPPSGALQTSIGMDTSEDAVLRYEAKKDETLEVTVNLKDLKAMVAFCEHVDVDVAIFADSPGAPVLVRPCAEFREIGGGGGGGGGGGYGQQQHGGYPQRGQFDGLSGVPLDAELVLASMIPLQQELDKNEGGAHGGGDGGAGAGGGFGGESNEDEDALLLAAVTQAEQRMSAAASRGGEITERSARGKRRAAKDADASVDAAASTGIPDSVDDGGGGGGRAREAVSVGNAGLAWAPGESTRADDTDDDDDGDQFVEPTPPDKRRRK
jgi:cell cycle checkpoint control protein RAD9A